MYIVQWNVYGKKRLYSNKIKLYKTFYIFIYFIYITSSLVFAAEILINNSAVPVI